MNSQDDACLSPEVLAAYVDGGLPESERERAEQHFAACDECWDVLVGTVQLIDSLRGPWDGDE